MRFSSEGKDMRWKKEGQYMGWFRFERHAWVVFFLWGMHGFFLVDGISMGCMGLLGRVWGARL